MTNSVSCCQAGGLEIEAAMGLDEIDLAVPGSTRKGPVIFRSVASIAMLLRRLGFARSAVDARKFVPGCARAARPDRAAAIKPVVVPNGGSQGKAGITK